MEEPGKLQILKLLGVFSILFPPVAIVMLMKFTGLSQFTVDLLICFFVFLIIFPFFFGFYLLVSFFTYKSGIILLLSILNIISPLWLIYFALFLAFSQGGGFRINM